VGPEGFEPSTKRIQAQFQLGHSSALVYGAIMAQRFGFLGYVRARAALSCSIIGALSAQAIALLPGIARIASVPPN
jgi:hypothetical protein